MHEPRLVLRDLTWSIGQHTVVNIAELAVTRGERLVLYGPNGAGKSTLLRLVAGVLGDREGSDVAYLPQRPYMFRGSGRRNLLLGLEKAASNDAEVLAKRLGVSNVIGTSANQLSGGERQRLGLARTLASRRPIVALDEPLSAIDAADRDAIVAVIGDALAERTALIVTHDEAVAAAFADRVAVMVAGEIRQIGTAQEVFMTPVGDDIAEFVGHHNVLQGTVTRSEGPLVQVLCGGLMVWALGSQAAGSEVRVMFGAEAVTLHTFTERDAELGRDSARNHWLGPVRAIREAGRLVEVVIDVGQPIAALITAGSLDGLGLQVDDKVGLSVKATAARTLTAAKQ